MIHNHLKNLKLNFENQLKNYFVAAEDAKDAKNKAHQLSEFQERSMHIDGMKELFRVLKQNGKAILQVPISKNSEKTFEDFSVKDPQERENIFGQFDHLRIYGQDYTKRLESVGFSVERINIEFV